jgi:hypothetical protein
MYAVICVRSWFSATVFLVAVTDAFLQQLSQIYSLPSPLSLHPYPISHLLFHPFLPSSQKSPPFPFLPPAHYPIYRQCSSRFNSCPLLQLPDTLPSTAPTPPPIDPIYIFRLYLYF